MKNTFLTLLFLLFSLIVIAQEVNIELFASGFSSPLNIQNAGDDRLFIVEQGGIIKILNPDGSINPIDFLDISSLTNGGGERGLLGLAFHPDYNNNGYFYVYYTDNSGDTQVSRFSVDGSDPNIADPGSELFIIDVAQPFSNHNGGCLEFGPDGYLYIGLGDGGSAGDPGNRAQNLLLLLGKLLRIDIDNPGGGNNYGIPGDNPFVGDPDALDEIWAYGLRNPWKFSFDSNTGDLWIGDVGQGSIEEINHELSTEGGLNYGWRCYEGNSPFNTAGCPDPSELTFPVAQYTHTSGNCSITGGKVYRGNIYSDIQGLYFFADVCSGMIGTVDDNGNLIDYGDFNGTWVSFGEDINGEIYIASLSGSIYKIQGGEILSNPENNIFNTVIMIPNPASDSLFLSVKNQKISTITILDLKGSLIFSDKDLSVTEITIPVVNLSKGVYLIKITTQDGNSFVKKLVIK